MPKFKDYSGLRYGRLVAIELSDPPRLDGETFWILKCDCGKIVSKPIRHCVDGSIKSCGCLLEEHYLINNARMGKAHKSLNRTSIAQIRKLLEKGESKKEICDWFSISRNTLNKYLRNEAEPRLRKGVLPQEVFRAIERLAPKYQTYKELADRIGVSIYPVYIYCKSKGLKLKEKK